MLPLERKVGEIVTRNTSRTELKCVERPGTLVSMWIVTNVPVPARVAFVCRRIRILEKSCVINQIERHGLSHNAII